MIFSQMKVPIELLEDERCIENLWNELSKQMKIAFGYETKYVVEFKKKIEQDRNTPYVILTLQCEIQQTTCGIHSYVAETLPVIMRDMKVSRWERLKQFVGGR